MKPLYEAQVTSHGGRDGHIKSSDGILDMKVSVPTSMGGKGGATNPEQLFAAGYAACFEGALNHVAKAQKVRITDTEVVATVAIGKTDAGAFQLGVKLAVRAQGCDRATLQKLVDEAHKTCPYSLATRGNIEVALSLG